MQGHRTGVVRSGRERKRRGPTKDDRGGVAGGEEHVLDVQPLGKQQLHEAQAVQRAVRELVDVVEDDAGLFFLWEHCRNIWRS